MLGRLAFGEALGEQRDNARADEAADIAAQPSDFLDEARRDELLPVGSHPDAMALSQSQNYLLVVNSGSGDVTVIQKRTPKKKFEPGEYSLLTMIPVGIQPNNIVVKAFVLARPKP